MCSRTSVEMLTGAAAYFYIYLSVIVRMIPCCLQQRFPPLGSQTPPRSQDISAGCFSKQTKYIPATQKMQRFSFFLARSGGI